MDARDPEYDVVVVGSGPGGSTAAYELSERGYDTLLVDEKTFPRDKLCGGIITHKTIRLLERVFGHSAEELHDEGVLDFGAHEYETYFDDERIIRDDIDEPFYFAKRYEYDAFLHRLAVEAGADTHLGDGVRTIDTDAGTVRTAAGEEFSANYVVGADGATSRVRGQLSAEGKVDASGWTENLAIGAEAYVPRDDIEYDVDHPVLHFGVLNWGYGWVFPNTDRLLVGVGGLNAKNDRGFREILDDYFDVLGIEYDPDVVKGHPIPFGNYLEYPADGNVLLIGDAAGTVDAITGEGIFYAQRSGELAVYAIDQTTGGEDSTADRYVSFLETHVHPELHDSKRVRPFIWAGPKLPRRLAMKAWFSRFGDPTVELVHGIRIYGRLRREGERMHDTVPDRGAGE